MPDSHALPDPLLEKARRWEEAWGLPGLLDSVTVEFSTRMRVSLGLCRPVEGRIRLAAGTATSISWKSLLVTAGYEPRVRIMGDDPRLPATFHKPRPRWEHRCPVCQARRVAGRPVRQWRCAACRDDGLTGKLVITKLPPPDEGSEEDGREGGG